MKAKSRKDCRRARHLRVRRKVSGTEARPRMSITMTNRRMYIQFVNDEDGKTLAAAASGTDSGSNAEIAKALGRQAGEAAMAHGIRMVVIDRGGHKFHGRVRAIVEGAIEVGLRTSASGGGGGASAPSEVEPDSDTEEQAANE